MTDIIHLTVFQWRMADSTDAWNKNHICLYILCYHLGVMTGTAVHFSIGQMQLFCSFF